MENQSQATLINYNLDNAEICASAARISTTQGNAVEIFEKARDNRKNSELIRRVLRSGHKSVIEHVVFTFAFKDVSAFVEQFLIECRLASFTVKSRRYVDFSSLGYRIPSDLKGENLTRYRLYMDHLFSSYKTLLNHGVPREDARFLLPYSFHSNFYCTINARELCHVLYDMKYGRGQGIPELQELAEQIIGQAEEVFPYIRSELAAAPAGDMSGSGAPQEAAVHVGHAMSLIDSREAGKVEMINKPSAPERILRTAYAAAHPDADGAFDVGDIANSERPRELEQLSYSFLISNVTLSGITHIVRHRMQSIIIPPIRSIDHSKCIVPDTIREDPRLFDIYKNVLETSHDRVRQMCANEELRKYSYYYALSGNLMDIVTTINARELLHFIKLRTCSRAQWEIRDISMDMLTCLRESFPGLFDHFGPSCFVTGTCPEGKMSCGRMNDVIRQFTS